MVSDTPELLRKDFLDVIFFFTQAAVDEYATTFRQCSLGGGVGRTGGILGHAKTLNPNRNQSSS